MHVSSPTLRQAGMSLLNPVSFPHPRMNTDSSNGKASFVPNLAGSDECTGVIDEGATTAGDGEDEDDSLDETDEVLHTQQPSNCVISRKISVPNTTLSQSLSAPT